MSPKKRFLDLLVMALLLPFVLPIALVTAALILVIDGRPIFYGQERIKTAKSGFHLWKFRTMTVSQSDAGVSGGHKSARITKLGHVLRRIHLDDIPQLWKVIAGDVSLVGPRPPLRSVVEARPAIYEQVLQSRPGLTGIASYFYAPHEAWILADCKNADETNAAYFRRCVPWKARLDLIYQNNWSVWLDVWIFWITAMRVLHLPFGRNPKVKYRKNNT